MKRRWAVRIPPDIAVAIALLASDRKKRLRAVLRQMEVDPHDGKSLVRELAGFFSYRVRPLRVVYRIEGKTVPVHSIGHRREIYEEAVDRIRKKER